MEESWNCLLKLDIDGEALIAYGCSSSGNHYISETVSWPRLEGLGMVVGNPVRIRSANYYDLTHNARDSC